MKKISIIIISMFLFQLLSASQKYDPIIKRASSQYGIPVSLIKSVMKFESNFNPYAVSPSGAIGLMQLMPETAKGLGVRNPFNPEENIFAGVRFLRILFDRYGGNVVLTLAAYNAGPALVDRFGGIPPGERTKKFVKDVLKDCKFYRKGLWYKVKDGQIVITNIP